MEGKNIFVITILFVLASLILTGCCSLLHKNTSPEDNNKPVTITNASNETNDFYTPGGNTTTPRSPSANDKKNVRYGTDSLLQIFDFYAPSQESDTLVVVIHGGAWIAGDKSYMASIVQFLAQQGYSVVNMDYRLAPLHKYPAPLEDITSVLNYVNTNHFQFLLKDNYKVVLIGHSAGAHLSALYGVKESEFGGMKNIDQVIGLSGPYDFVDLELGGAESPSLEAFLGSTPILDVSPARQIKDHEKTEFLLIQGADDQLVPVSQLTIFEAALKAKNVPVDTLIVPGKDHNSILNQIPQNDSVAQKIINFIN